MRYQAVKGTHHEWFVVDTGTTPMKVICTCFGWRAPIDVENITEAMNTRDAPIAKLRGDNKIIDTRTK